MKKQHSGGVVDRCISQRAMNLIQDAIGEGAESEALLEKIRDRVGSYRDYREARDTTPQDAVAIDHLAKLRKQALELRDGLDSLPQVGKAWAYDRAQKTWGRDLIQDIDLDLARLAALLKFVGNEYHDHPSTAGEKPKMLEHSLLADVYDLVEPFLKTGKEQTADFAANLLRNIGIHHMPSGGRKARQVIVDWRKKEKTLR
jgi:hypothetical protein